MNKTHVLSILEYALVFQEEAKVSDLSLSDNTAALFK